MLNLPLGGLGTYKHAVPARGNHVRYPLGAAWTNKTTWFQLGATMFCIPVGGLGVEFSWRWTQPYAVTSTAKQLERMRGNSLRGHKTCARCLGGAPYGATKRVRGVPKLV
eukprot:6542628-Pyramimonas_sp.AAC.1